jgi:hypothetical protein
MALWVGDSGLELYTMVACPLPGGYFGRKIIIFNVLQGDNVCKILIINRLFTKYLLSIV